MSQPVNQAGIAAALAAAQAEMGRAIKDKNNPAFKSRYADLASVMDACMAALTRHGIAVIQPPGECEGVRFVETRLIHGASNEELSCRVPLIIGKNDMQGYGSAVTYARRFGLMCMAGIAPDDDDGNDAAAAAPKNETTPAQFDASAAAARIAAKLVDAANLTALADAWRGESEAISRIKAVDPDQANHLTAIKDRRKAQLSAPAQVGVDVGGDEIPY